MQKITAIILTAVFFMTACSSSAPTPTNSQTTNKTSNSSAGEQTSVNQANVNKPSENKPAANKTADEMPNFAKGEGYKSVREKLIKAGWTPFKSKEADECFGDDERCRDFPEMESCAGTGFANCRYLWKKSNKTLVIFTVGEKPEYDGQEFQKPDERNPADREDTAWRGGALVHTPPTNIRESPGGKVICVIREEKLINVNGSTNITDEDGEWIRTDACGRPGVVHSSQINIAN